jgi:hypothetical protein
MFRPGERLLASVHCKLSEKSRTYLYRPANITCMDWNPLLGPADGPVTGVTGVYFTGVSRGGSIPFDVC